MKKGFQPILDYVEGRMSITEFQFLFETDKSLQRTLKLPMDKKYTCYKRYNYNLFDLFKNYYDYKGKSWNIFANRSSIQGELVRLLEDYNISYHIYSKYKEEYRFLLQIQPDYIDCQDDSILQPIIDSIPKDLSKTKRIAMGKEKVKALFKYDKTYPRWVQGAEWPIVNGKPLVFSHQKKAKGGDIRTYYYFYDPDTKEQTVVEQFD
mgnify:CR=1 FL=1